MIVAKKNYQNLLDNYKKILKIMLPIIPHITSECLSEVSDDKNLKWPEINKKYLDTGEHNMVIQINGKKRGLISTENNINEKNLIKQIENTNKIQKFLINKKIIKSIFIKNKLINLIVK